MSRDEVCSVCEKHGPDAHVQETEPDPGAPGSDGDGLMCRWCRGIRTRMINRSPDPIGDFLGLGATR